MKDRYSVYSDDVMHEQLSAVYSFTDFTSLLEGYITRVQLKDREMWRLTVAQFRNSSPDFGVDDADKGWRCEYWGKLMRGACFIYRVTKDEELYSVLEETVLDMLSTQDNLGRFSTYSLEKEFNGWDIWGRKYIMLGMIYFLDVCKDASLKERIISALTRHADYMLSRLGREEDGKLNIAKCTSHWDGLNSCSILEPFIFLYNLTGEQRYLDFSEYIVSFGGTAGANLFDITFENATAIKDFPQRKAYEMMSCFEGLAEYVRIRDSEKYRKALKNFADRILSEEVSVIGCCGCDFECFDGTVESQFDKEKQNNVMQETCVTVTWMKFCWQILRMYGDVRYADALEVSLYNAFGGAILSPTEAPASANGGIPLPIDSYSPLRAQSRRRKMGGRKTITPNGTLYDCCVAIAAAGFGVASFASVVPSSGGAYINLYRSGSVKVNILGADVTFGFDTCYPKKNTIKINIGVEEPLTFGITLRIPSFSKKSEVRAGGEAYAPSSGYFEIRREWSSGDTIELTFDMPIRAIRPRDLVPDTDADDCICFARGPVILAADERLCDGCSVSLPEEDILLPEYGEATAPIPHHQAYTLFPGTKYSSLLIDYASAGHGEGAGRCACFCEVKKFR